MELESSQWFPAAGQEVENKLKHGDLPENWGKIFYSEGD